MTPVGTKSAVLRNDQIQSALDDPLLRAELLRHAMAVIGKRLRDRPTAYRQDAAMVALQETCLRALEKQQNYDPDLPVRPWLHGIMNFVLCESIRGTQRMPDQQCEDGAAWEALAVDLTPDIAETVPNRDAVMAHLASMREKDRQVLEMRFYEGLSHEEIGARLGISNGNARVRLSRALIALKALACGALKGDN